MPLHHAWERWANTGHEHCKGAVIRCAREAVIRISGSSRTFRLGERRLPSASCATKQETRRPRTPSPVVQRPLMAPEPQRRMSLKCRGLDLRSPYLQQVDTQWRSNSLVTPRGKPTDHFHPLHTETLHRCKTRNQCCSGAKTVCKGIA